MKNVFILIGFCLMIISGAAFSAGKSLWGGAVVKHIDYKPQKVVYDVQ